MTATRFPCTSIDARDAVVSAANADDIDARAHGLEVVATATPSKLVGLLAWADTQGHIDSGRAKTLANTLNDNPGDPA